MQYNCSVSVYCVRKSYFMVVGDSIVSEVYLKNIHIKKEEEEGETMTII